MVHECKKKILNLIKIKKDKIYKINLYFYYTKIQDFNFLKKNKIN